MSHVILVALDDGFVIADFIFVTVTRTCAYIYMCVFPSCNLFFVSLSKNVIFFLFLCQKIYVGIRSICIYVYRLCACVCVFVRVCVCVYVCIYMY